MRLPADALVGDEDAGLLQLFAGLNPERIMTAAFALGMGRYALGQAVDYARTRQVWKTPIGAHQAIAHPLAQAHIDLELARLMMHKAAHLYDAGDDMGAGEAANMAKYAAGEAVVKAVDQAVHTLGGNGLTREYGLASLHHRLPGRPDRTRQPRDDPQLRLAPEPRPAQVVLSGETVTQREEPLVRTAHERGITTLTLDSPHNRNALSARLVAELTDALTGRRPTTPPAPSSSPTPGTPSAPAPTCARQAPARRATPPTGWPRCCAASSSCPNPSSPAPTGTYGPAAPGCSAPATSRWPGPVRPSPSPRHASASPRPSSRCRCCPGSTRAPPPATT